jgi:hypothetical protein
MNEEQLRVTLVANAGALPEDLRLIDSYTTIGGFMILAWMYDQYVCIFCPKQFGFLEILRMPHPGLTDLGAKEVIAHIATIIDAQNSRP